MSDLIRTESDIVNDIEVLCTSPGYVHVIAFYCFKDTVISYRDKINPDELSYLYSYERLIRSEISTLIGFLVKREIDFSTPNSQEMKYFIEKTDLLLKELHDSLLPVSNNVESLFSENGPSFREPIFYDADAAYIFQYADFSLKKYNKDSGWLSANKGFSIEDARSVLKSISKIQNHKLKKALDAMMKIDREQRTFLPAFIFYFDEILDSLNIERQKLENILNSFSLSQKRIIKNLKVLMISI